MDSSRFGSLFSPYTLVLAEAVAHLHRPAQPVGAGGLTQARGAHQARGRGGYGEVETRQGNELDGLAQHLAEGAQGVAGEPAVGVGFEELFAVGVVTGAHK